MPSDVGGEMERGSGHAYTPNFLVRGNLRYCVALNTTDPGEIIW